MLLEKKTTTTKIDWPLKTLLRYCTAQLLMAAIKSSTLGHKAGKIISSFGSHLKNLKFQFIKGDNQDLGL